MTTFKVSDFDKKLLGRLSSTVWQSHYEIGESIAVERRRNRERRYALGIASMFMDQDVAELFILRPSIASMCISSAKFEQSKVVESRWREEPPEKTAQRGGHRIREYKLTEDGARFRAVLLS